MEEKQRLTPRSLGGLHHAYIVCFCGFLLCPSPCACPQSLLQTALHWVVCHLLEGDRDRRVHLQLENHHRSLCHVQMKMKTRFKGEPERLRGINLLLPSFQDYNDYVTSLCLFKISCTHIWAETRIFDHTFTHFPLWRCCHESTQIWKAFLQNNCVSLPYAPVIAPQR